VGRGAQVGAQSRASRQHQFGRRLERADLRPGGRGPDRVDRVPDEVDAGGPRRLQRAGLVEAPDGQMGTAPAAVPPGAPAVAAPACRRRAARIRYSRLWRAGNGPRRGDGRDRHGLRGHRGRRRDRSRRRDAPPGRRRPDRQTGTGCPRSPPARQKCPEARARDRGGNRQGPVAECRRGPRAGHPRRRRRPGVLSGRRAGGGRRPRDGQGGVAVRAAEQVGLVELVFAGAGGLRGRAVVGRREDAHRPGRRDGQDALEGYFGIELARAAGRAGRRRAGLDGTAAGPHRAGHHPPTTAATATRRPSGFSCSAAPAWSSRT
jgi:hypothetical protein